MFNYVTFEPNFVEIQRYLRKMMFIAASWPTKPVTCSDDTRRFLQQKSQNVQDVVTARDRQAVFLLVL